MRNIGGAAYRDFSTTCHKQDRPESCVPGNQIRSTSTANVPAFGLFSDGEFLIYSAISSSLSLTNTRVSSLLPSCIQYMVSAAGFSRRICSSGSRTSSTVWTSCWPILLTRSFSLNAMPKGNGSRVLASRPLHDPRNIPFACESKTKVCPGQPEDHESLRMSLPIFLAADFELSVERARSRGDDIAAQNTTLPGSSSIDSHVSC
jgi:hypothetical protein